MLDKKVFLNCLGIILATHDIEPKEITTKSLYELLKNDFTNEEFSKACMDICKEEALYGKYPTPNMFYKRKKQEQNNILVEVGSLYIDDTFPAYKKALEGLPQDIVDNICSKVWEWIIANKHGEFVSEEFIVERLKQFRPYPLPEKDVIQERKNGMFKLGDVLKGLDYETRKQ